jgi:hypothetical protein
MLISGGCQASLDLGTWKARLNSTDGKTLQIVRLYSCCEESLEGNAIGAKGETEGIDFGHKDGDFLAFTMNLRWPDGGHIQARFVGKMSNYRIVGTFIDNTGITGSGRPIG